MANLKAAQHNKLTRKPELDTKIYTLPGDGDAF